MGCRSSLHGRHGKNDLRNKNCSEYHVLFYYISTEGIPESIVEASENGKKRATNSRTSSKFILSSMVHAIGVLLARQFKPVKEPDRHTRRRNGFKAPAAASFSSARFNGSRQRGASCGMRRFPNACEDKRCSLI